jgi:hypothetical protein
MAIFLRILFTFNFELMKKFLKKILLFGLLFLLLLLSQKVLDKYTPWYWGNDTLATKLEFISTNQDEYDAFFIGSSHSFRGANPAVFDSITGLKSFNMGVPGMAVPELFMTVEHMINQKGDNTKRQVFFVELTEVHRATIKDGNAVRRDYWMNLDSYSFGIRYLSEGWNLGSMYRYTSSLIHFETKFGLGRPQYQSIDSIRNGQFPLGPKKNGYHSLKDQLKAKINTPSIINRRIRFEEDTSLIVKKAQYMLAEPEMDIIARQAYLDKIDDLIREAKEKNIDIIFIRMPIQEDIWSTLQAIPEAHRLDLGDPKKYALLYQAKYFSDKGHLNATGARIYTTNLVAAFKEKGLSQ